MTLLTDHQTPTSTATTLRPRFEGSNICTWIGFKHVNYVVEEAVLDHFRAAPGPARASCTRRHGLGVDIVDMDTRILHALHMRRRGRRDRARRTRDAERPALQPCGSSSTATAPAGQGGHREGPGRCCAGTTGRRRTPADPPPAGSSSRPWTRSGGRPGGGRDRRRGIDPVGRGTVTRDGPGGLRTGDGPAFAWSWRIPYFYCHFTERLQMSGYLRQMEEVVDLFLAERGISIRTLLDEPDWIPVVPHSGSRSSARR